MKTTAKEQFLKDWDEGDTDNRSTPMSKDLEGVIKEAIQSQFVNSYTEQLKDEKIRLLEIQSKEYKITVNWLFKHSPDALNSERGKIHIDTIHSITEQINHLFDVGNESTEFSAFKMAHAEQIRNAEQIKAEPKNSPFCLFCPAKV